MNRVCYCRFMVISTILLIVVWEQFGFACPKKNVMQEQVMNGKAPHTMAGFTLGNFWVFSDRFKEIYGNAGPVTGMEASHVLPLNHKSSLGLSLEIRRFCKGGSSTVSSQNTYFLMTPITFTGRYVITKGNFSPFVGTGLDFFWYKEESSIGDTSGSSAGFHLEGGVYYTPPFFEFMKIKAGVRLSQSVARENSIKVNLGGLELAIGIFYCFRI